MEAGKLAPAMVTLIALLIFVGAVGKSGQFPLHTWLPDAMEGPTPVSALIHAATMVAAGVYLVARSFPFCRIGDGTGCGGYVGAFTALFAATIALVQNDIKRVLAYSTVSQLGYMMLALGAAGYVAGVFHLFTHAFFKALLFLGRWGGDHCSASRAGHPAHGRLCGSGNPPVGWLFLSAVWPSPESLPFPASSPRMRFCSPPTRTAGRGLSAGSADRLFTAFYMFRLFFKVFFGTYRGEGEVGSVPGVMVCAHGGPRGPVGSGGLRSIPFPRPGRLAGGRGGAACRRGRFRFGFRCLRRSFPWPGSAWPG